MTVPPDEEGAVEEGSMIGRSIIAFVAALAVVALLVYARGEPGVGGRFPDAKSTRPAGVLVVPAPGG